jgi:hypothetical protein
MSMPLAGALMWCAIAILGVVLPPRTALFALLSGTGAIFPLALIFAKIRSEQLIANRNEFAGLMVACVFMVNLLWAVHIPLLFKAPSLVPLSLGIGLGLHWVVYSWVIQHPLGYVHATLRTVGVFFAWLCFPTHSITACAIVVVATYCVALWQMATRRIDKSVLNSALPGNHVL